MICFFYYNGFKFIFFINENWIYYDNDKEKKIISKYYLIFVDVKNSLFFLKKYNLNEIKEKCSVFIFKNILFIIKVCL